MEGEDLSAAPGRKLRGNCPAESVDAARDLGCLLLAVYGTHCPWHARACVTLSLTQAYAAKRADYDTRAAELDAATAERDEVRVVGGSGLREGEGGEG